MRKKMMNYEQQQWWLFFELLPLLLLLFLMAVLEVQEVVIELEEHQDLICVDVFLLLSFLRYDWHVYQMFDVVVVHQQREHQCQEKCIAPADQPPLHHFYLVLFSSSFAAGGAAQRGRHSLVTKQLNCRGGLKILL